MALFLSILFLVVGAILVVFEIFTPGFGLFGISGIISIILSAIITITYIPFGIVIVIAEVLIVAAIVVVLFDYIRKKQLYGKLILDETLNEDKSDIGDLELFIGKEGVTKSPLRPHGNVDFSGVTVPVFSDGAYIQTNVIVKVSEVKGQNIIVKEISNKEIDNKEIDNKKIINNESTSNESTSNESTSKEAKEN